MVEIQTEDERIDYVVERVVETASISEGEKEAINDLINAFPI